MKLSSLCGFITVSLLPVAATAQPAAQGAQFRVNAFTTGLQIRPDVAHTADGGFVVVWVSYDQVSDTSDSDVFGRLHDAGGSPLGADFVVNAYTTDRQSRVAVASNASGAFVVVWVGSAQQDGDDDGIFGQRYDAGGNPVGTEFQVNAYTTGDQSGAHVGVAADGSFVVVWEDEDGRDGGLSGIFGRRFSAIGEPAGEDFAVNTHTTGYQRAPVIDVAGTGEFVVAWSGGGQDDPRTSYGAGVFAQRFSAAGGAVGTEFQVNTFTTGYQQSSAVAIQSGGGFIVAWQDTSQLSRDGIFARRYDPGGSAVGGELAVHTYATADKEAPSIATGDDGAFTVTWASIGQDGSARGVFGRRFDASASALGGEFQVNTYTTSSQYRAEVSDDGSGEIVVVWQQREATPSDDIYAQRFSVSAVAGICGDPVANVYGEPPVPEKVITASDALLILRTAVGLEACEPCVCDVNDSGSITASDALAVLGAAVGQPVQLSCPAC